MFRWIQTSEWAFTKLAKNQFLLVLFFLKEKDGYIFSKQASPLPPGTNVPIHYTRGMDIPGDRVTAIFVYFLFLFLTLGFFTAISR